MGGKRLLANRVCLLQGLRHLRGLWERWVSRWERGVFRDESKREVTVRTLGTNLAISSQSDGAVDRRGGTYRGMSKFIDMASRILSTRSAGRSTTIWRVRPYRPREWTRLRTRQ